MSYIFPASVGSLHYTDVVKTFAISLCVLVRQLLTELKYKFDKAINTLQRKGQKGLGSKVLQNSFRAECPLQGWHEARPRRYRNKQRFPADGKFTVGIAKRRHS